MNYRKYLPFILLGVGVLVLVVGFLFMKGGKKDEAMEDEDANVAEVPVDKRPYTTLTPSEDGHWLTLKLTDLKFDAESVEYQIVYTLPDGRNQGVPGTPILLSGTKDIERKLLLGTESSGKYYYDENVKEGTLTLRYRDSKGKLIGKLSTKFHLQKGDEKLTSIDGKFSFELDEALKDSYFITISTFGLPKALDGQVEEGPYGVFTSTEDDVSGTVSLGGKVMYFGESGEWEELTDSSGVGVFVGVSQ